MISLTFIAQICNYIYEHHFKKKHHKHKKPFNKFERDGNTHLYVILTLLSSLVFFIISFLRIEDNLILQLRHLIFIYFFGILSGIGITMIIKTAIHNHEVKEAFREQGKLVENAKKKADEQMDRLEELTK